MPSTSQALIAQLAAEIRVSSHQVQTAIELLDGGATVPFIARYRKEATGGLDDIQLRELEARLSYLRELHDRLQTVIKAIDEQGKLTPTLLAALHAASTKQVLEDLYLPFKLKRRTKGQMAIEAGLLPLADALFANPALTPADEARAYVISPEVADAAALKTGDKQPDFSTIPAVLDGVRDILSERWAELPLLVQSLREWLWEQGLFKSTLLAGKNENDAEIAKFRDYFDYDEPIARVPSHRALAVFRGRTLDILEVKLITPDVLDSNSASGLEKPPQFATESGVKPPSIGTNRPTGSTPPVSLAEARIAMALQWRHQNRPADELLKKCVSWTWRVKLSLSLERDLFARLREAAEKVAIKVFADNLRDLLLAAPAGPRVVMGLDPGIRTGVKVAVVDATGKLVDTATVFPHEPRKDWDGALHQLSLLCHKHGVNLIAIGNGTASRETDKLAGELIKRLSTLTGDGASRNSILGMQGKAQTADIHLYGEDLQRSHAPENRIYRGAIEKVVVSEAGASVYSASAFASEEMPDVDVSLRGAASIARRLQDPLAELVKIDPKSIGVGQYQHDVNQTDLVKTLDTVVEDCVNRVGVDLNTASVPLLTRVSGLSPSVAKAVVRYRESHGAFSTRQELLQVTGLGAKTFEQSAGFLRIRGGSNPLDMTGVHPETYPLVEKIIEQVKKPVAELMGRSEVFKTLRPEMFADAAFGAITVKDVLAELEKPGRDARPDFKVAKLDESVQDISDLKEGMLLEGTVSNVAAFGAFIDLGVHQDGLVHVSQLAHKFVSDAREVVKTGDIVKVQVLEVDVARKRISLTMKLVQGGGQAVGQTVGQGRGSAGRPGENRFEPVRPDGRSRGQGGASSPQLTAGNTAMASAFARLKP